jgi:diazepam-binding inhibitor (GABA receptor modulating acyl-CoA-binding protein)
MLDLKGKAKWDAWNKIKGMNQEEAKSKYAQVVNQLLSKY